MTDNISNLTLDSRLKNSGFRVAGAFTWENLAKELAGLALDIKKGARSSKVAILPVEFAYQGHSVVPASNEHIVYFIPTESYAKEHPGPESASGSQALVKFHNYNGEPSQTINVAEPNPAELQHLEDRTRSESIIEEMLAREGWRYETFFEDAYMPKALMDIALELAGGMYEDIRLIASDCAFEGRIFSPENPGHVLFSRWSETRKKYMSDKINMSEEDPILQSDGNGTKIYKTIGEN